MSQFGGKFDIVSTDLRIILSNFAATDDYGLFKKSIKIFLQHDVQNEGGGTVHWIQDNFVKKK